MAAALAVGAPAPARVVAEAGAPAAVGAGGADVEEWAPVPVAAERKRN